EFAADFHGGVRLRVEPVDVAWPAFEPEQDAARLRLRVGRTPGRLQSQEARQAQPKRGQSADAEKRPAGHTGAVGRSAGDQVEHGGTPKNRRATKAGNGQPWPLYLQSGRCRGKVKREKPIWHKSPNPQTRRSPACRSRPR